jgi:hypothetical protein
MNFGLKEGMEKKEIVQEMWGRTSGESRGQVLQVLKPREERMLGAKIKQCTIDMFAEYVILRKNWAFGRRLKVHKANAEYALIQELKSHSRLRARDMKVTAKTVSSDDYYLAGISDDEEKYFLHKLETTQTRQMAMAVSNYEMDLKVLVDFIDRKEEGFERRVQGDLLLKFVEIKEEKQTTLDGKDEIDFLFYVLPDGSRKIMLGFHVNNWSRLTIGRHRLLTNGERVYVSWPHHDYRVFGGQSITITHPEHKMVQVKIPQNHLAIIGVQRGPNAGMEGD